MRILLLVTSAVLFLAGTPLAQAACCPAIATTASFSLWPENSIPTESNVSGAHPCGRRLGCIGAVNSRKATRRCRWL